MSDLDRGSGTLAITLMREAFITAVDRVAIAVRDDVSDAVLESHCVVARAAGDAFARELSHYLVTYERVRTELGAHGVTPSN